MQQILHECQHVWKLLRELSKVEPYWASRHVSSSCFPQLQCFQPTQSTFPCCADGKASRSSAEKEPPTYKAPAFNAPDVERGMLTKQKQPLGEEPRDFIRYKSAPQPMPSCFPRPGF
jgi:hypothetical protein